MEPLKQTDFGRIYYNSPSQVFSPKSTQELAQILKTLNESKTPVTIRNTGHSVNGQTLTSGVQIDVGALSHVKFDQAAMTVTAAAGVTWDEVLKAINFPTYCTPIFPNNPGQQIKVGGTTSVGGIGIYAVSCGGFWRVVESLEVVTMEGKIIKCSKDENPDVFKYSLGGFGKIGVISEVTLRVEKSGEDLLVMGMFYTDSDKFFSDIDKMFHSNKFKGMFCGKAPIHLGKTKLAVAPYSVAAVYELEDNENPEDAFDNIKNSLGEGFLTFFKDGQDNYSPSLKLASSKKRSAIYWYPDIPDPKTDDSHRVWMDLIVPKESFLEFVTQKAKIQKNYGITQYIVSQSLAGHKLEIAADLHYVVRNDFGGFEYPLSLDISGAEPYYFDVSYFPNVPAAKLQDALKAAEEISDLVYEMGGKKYMYGINKFKEGQLEKQYGKEVLSEWRRLKKQLDPNNLLNVDVLFRL